MVAPKLRERTHKPWCKGHLRSTYELQRSGEGANQSKWVSKMKVIGNDKQRSLVRNLLCTNDLKPCKQAERTMDNQPQQATYCPSRWTTRIAL